LTFSFSVLTLLVRQFALSKAYSYPHWCCFGRLGVAVENGPVTQKLCFLIF